MVSAQGNDQSLSRFGRIANFLLFESMVAWQLGSYFEGYGHFYLKDLCYYVLFISIVGAILRELRPSFPGGVLVFAWIIIAFIIAFFMAMQAGHPMPTTGKIRFLLPIFFTVFTGYSWYWTLHQMGATPTKMPPRPSTFPATIPTTQTQSALPPQPVHVSAVALPPPMSGYRVPDGGYAPSVAQAQQIVRSGRHLCEALTAIPKNSADSENFVIKGTEALKQVYGAYLRHVQADGKIIMMYAGWPEETQGILGSINKSISGLANKLGWLHLLEGYDAKILPSVDSPLATGESLGEVKELSLLVDRLWQEVISVLQKQCVELQNAAEKTHAISPQKNLLADDSPVAAESEFAEAKDKREFVTLDLKYIRTTFENTTDINAKTVVERFIGKWTETTGKVENVQDTGNYLNLLIDHSTKEMPHFWLSFDLKWRDTLSQLEKGSDVKVRGKIGFIGEMFISLEECELITDAEINAAVALQKHQEAMRALQNEFAEFKYNFAPRRISDAGLEAMKKSLAQYAGQKFTITIQIGDTYELVQNQEPQSFAVGLGIALRKCGWSGDASASNEFGAATGETGVGVYAVAVDGDAEWGAPIVRDLEHALQAEGIQLSEKIVIAHKARHNPNFKDKLIRIVVGRKPPLANDA